MSTSLHIISFLLLLTLIFVLVGYQHTLEFLKARFIACVYIKCMWFVTVRQMFVCGRTTKSDSTCWRKGRVSVACSVHCLWKRRLCSMLNKSSQSICLLTIFTPSQTDQIASAIIDGRSLPWQHFNSRLVSSLPSMTRLPQFSYLYHCHIQQKLSVIDCQGSFADLLADAVVKELHILHFKFKWQITFYISIRYSVLLKRARLSGDQTIWLEAKKLFGEMGKTGKLHPFVVINVNYCLQCFDTVGWAAGRVSGL